MCLELKEMFQDKEIKEMSIPNKEIENRDFKFKHLKNTYYIIFLFILFASISVYSEQLVLKNGKVFTGDIVKETDVLIVINSRGSEISIRKDQIAKINKKKNEYKKRNTELVYNKVNPDKNKDKPPLKIIKKAPKKRIRTGDTVYVKKYFSTDTIVFNKGEFWGSTPAHFNYRGKLYEFTNRNLTYVSKNIPCDNANVLLKRCKALEVAGINTMIFCGILIGAVIRYGGSELRKDVIPEFNKCILDTSCQKPFKLYKSSNRFIISNGWNITFWRGKKVMGPEMELGLRIKKHFYGITGQVPSIDTDWGGFGTEGYSDCDNGGGGFVYYFEGLTPPEYIDLSIGAAVGFWYHWYGEDKNNEMVVEDEHFLFGGPKVKLRLGGPLFHISSNYNLLLGTNILHSFSFHINIGMRRTILEYIMEEKR